MGQREFPIKIVLRGEADSTIGKLSNSLVELGTYVDHLSSKIRDVEKESLEIYKNYQTSMLEAKGALTTTTASTAELDRTYKNLEKHAQQWAASTIFHTDDVAAAIAEASHAGWDYSQMIEGIPSAMLLAQAGGMSLSDALDDLIKIMNGSGTSFADSQKLVDEWALAANSSATTISEMGDAMTAMGQTMQFAGSTAELVSMLGLLANNGTTGAKAGTLLRNAMIRLVAPTSKAAETMEALGASEEEIEEALSETGTSADELGELYKTLGLNAYDEAGRLRPMMDIFEDLNTLTADMSEKDRNDVLSKIFPLRSITAGLALLGASRGEWQDFYKDVLGADGYAQRVAEIQTSGVWGTEELTASKWEELERKIGEILSMPYEGMLTGIGNVLDKLNNADPVLLETMTGALTALGVAGPAFAGGGLLIKTIGILTAHPVVAGLIGATIAIGGMIGAISGLNKAQYEELKSNFGDLGLSTSTLTTYVNGLGEATGAEGLYQSLNSFNAALSQSEAAYDSARSTLGQGLLDAVSGVNVTPSQRQALITAGNDMAQAVMDGIKASQEGSYSLLDALFGGNMDDSNLSTYNFIDSANQSLFANQYAEAYAIGEELRSQMTKALADNQLDDSERNAINATVARLDEIEAEIQGKREKAEHLAKLNRMGALGLEGFGEIAGEIDTYTKSRTDAIADAVAKEQAYLQMAWEEATVNADGSRTFAWRDANGKQQTRVWTERQFNAAMAELGARGTSETSELQEAADRETRAWFRRLVGDNGYGSALDLWEAAREQYAGESSSNALALMARQNGLTYGQYTAYLDQLNTLRRAASSQGVSDTLVASMLGDGDFLDAWNPEMSLDIDQQSVNEANATREEIAKPINVPVHYNVSTWRRESNFWARDRALSEYAEGGRATSASIFGEAGAEWAIPEEHNQRTAALLDSARQASGFSWGELIARTGGLSGNANNVSVPLTYAPTIYAGSSSGLAEVLKQDKKELIRLMRDVMRDQKLMQAVAAY